MTDLNQTDWNEADASNTAASPNGWPSGMLPSAVEPSARALRGALKRFYNQINPTVTSGGSANTQTLTYAVARTAYVAGDPYAFKAGFTNTGATTLNVNVLGAKTVQLAGAALVANDIQAGFYYGVVYDGTNFQLVFSSALITPSRLPTSGISASAITTGTLPGAQLPVPASVSGGVTAPAATSSPSLVMMGLGSAWFFTPSSTGKAIVIISGDAANSSNGGFTYQIRYGTGAAPANGVALAGSAGSATATNVPSTGFAVPFSTQFVATGLTLGTPYWFDLALAVLGSGAASLTNLTVSALES